MFWIDNVIMSILFMIALILLMPIIFLKILYNLFRSMRWYNFLWIGFWWIIFGTLVLPIYILKDIIYFYKINCFDGTVTATEAKKIHREERKLKIEHLNNIYEVMRGIFIEMNRKSKISII